MIKLKRLTILFTIVWLPACGQEIITACGADKNPKLNKCELEFLDSFFADDIFKKKNYDFSNKNFAFVSGEQLMDKDDFFKSINIYRGPKGFDFFDNEERTKTGYDGAIMINLKMYNKNNIIKLIEKKTRGNR